MKVSFFYVFLFLIIISLPTKSQVNFDSLESVILKMPDDTAKVNRLTSLIAKMQFANPQKAEILAKNAIVLSQKLKYPFGLAYSYRLRGLLFFDKTIIDSAKMYYDLAWPILKDGKDNLMKKQKGSLLLAYGTIHHQNNILDSALYYYQQAADTYISANAEDQLFYPYVNESVLHLYLKDYKKAMFLAKKAYDIGVQKKDLNKQIWAANNYYAAKIEAKQYDSVENPLKENIKIALQVENISRFGLLNNLLAKFFQDGKKQYDSAIYYYTISIDAATKIEDKFEIAATTLNLGGAYMDKKDFSNASKYLAAALKLANELKIDNIKQYALNNLYLAEEAKGDYKLAFSYMKQYLVVSDSVDAKYNRENVVSLEKKYASEKKDNQIKLQQAEIKSKQAWNYLLGGGGAALALISVFGYRSYSNRQKADMHRIQELETEKQLAATEAVLKGEEQERTRLAKDLHDGLGGMLSGIKYSFNNMKENLILTPDTAQAFSRSMDMLDNSIQEMRRVAHNMMPEPLLRYGLHKTLQDYVTDVNKNGVTKIIYQGIKMETLQLDNSTAVTIYRIVQELINNTLKHAAAKNMLVQLLASPNGLVLNVEDDGKGFDTKIIELTNGGIGWKNIKSRVDLLKGTLKVESSKDSGTQVNIELTV